MQTHAKKHTHKPKRPRARFNVICHGLMVYWQNRKDGTLSILIPGEKEHEFKVGKVSGEEEGTKGLEKLPKGRLELFGVERGSMTTADMLDAFDIPVMKQSLLERTHKERTEIVVPTPDEIRGYCDSELDRKKYLGCTPAHLFLKIPSVVSDVIVLSWDRVNQQGGFLKHGGRKIKARMQQQEEGTTFFNLCVYAEPPKADKELPEDHGKTVNRLMRVKRIRLDLHPMLHGVVPDGAPEDTSIGISTDELESLMALDEPPQTDKTGCTSNAVIDDCDLSKHSY